MPDLSLISLYSIYALAAALLTFFLARVLFQNGHAFLEDVFPGKPKFATSVNKLLVVGFYLTNFGYALTYPPLFTDLSSHAIRLLMTSLGSLMLVLAFMHFANLFVFYRIRRRALGNRPPSFPTMPESYTTPFTKSISEDAAMPVAHGAMATSAASAS